jgi:hypothetical protein
MTVHCEAYVRQPEILYAEGVASVRLKAVECDMT